MTEIARKRESAQKGKRDVTGCDCVAGDEMAGEELVIGLWEAAE